MDSQDLVVLRRAVGWLEAGRRVALVTVVATWGSAPRPVGALLALDEDGQPCGSVSGGCVEDDLVARLRARFPTACQVMNYGVTAEDARRFGLPCGGTLRLVVEPLAGPEVLRPALAALERGALLARRVRLADGAVRFQSATPEESLTFDGDVLTQIFGPRWRLLIVGRRPDFLLSGVHGAGAGLSGTGLRSAGGVRPGVDRDRRGTGAGHARRCGARHRARPAHRDRRPHPRSETGRHGLDGSAENPGVLRGRARFGRHTARRRERLALLDVTEEERARLHGPVGLPIGSRTPPEIAISILAELTALRHGRVLAPVRSPVARAAVPP